MIQLFKRNDLANVVFLLPYVVILRIYSLINPVAYTSDGSEGWLSVLTFEHLVAGPLAQSIAGIFLVYVQANLINFLINRNRLLHIPAALPGLTYVLLTSLMPQFQGLSPALIGMTFLILACFSLFGLYKNSRATVDIFNSAISLSLATFFYFPFAIVLIPMLIEISILRSFNVKERLQYLCGFLVLYWIVGSALFFSSQERIISFVSFKFPGVLSEMWPLSLENIILLSVLLAFVVFCLMNYFTYMKKKGIEARKKIDFFYWLMLFALVPLFLFSGLDMTFLYLLCLPVSIFFGMTFLNIRNNSMAELIHIFLLIGLFLLHYGEGFGII